MKYILLTMLGFWWALGGAQPKTLRDPKVSANERIAHSFYTLLVLLPALLAGATWCWKATAFYGEQVGQIVGATVFIIIYTLDQCLLRATPTSTFRKSTSMFMRGGLALASALSAVVPLALTFDGQRYNAHLHEQSQQQILQAKNANEAQFGVLDANTAAENARTDLANFERSAQAKPASLLALEAAYEESLAARDQANANKNVAFTAEANHLSQLQRAGYSTDEINLDWQHSQLIQRRTSLVIAARNSQTALNTASGQAQSALKQWQSEVETSRKTLTLARNSSKDAQLTAQKGFDGAQGQDEARIKAENDPNALATIMGYVAFAMAGDPLARGLLALLFIVLFMIDLAPFLLKYALDHMHLKIRDQERLDAESALVREVLDRQFAAQHSISMVAVERAAALAVYPQFAETLAAVANSKREFDARVEAAFDAGNALERLRAQVAARGGSFSTSDWNTLESLIRQMIAPGMATRTQP